MILSRHFDRQASRAETSFAIRAVAGLALPLALLGMALFQPALASAPAVERFVLNALLAHAFDSDQLPFVWADPRPRIICAAGTRVRIDGTPLRDGAPVPERPFRMSWDMRGCRPFGITGPRFDGLVDLLVVRESWGFSALVEPESLIVTHPDGTLSRLRRSRETMPRQRVDDAAEAM